MRSSESIKESELLVSSSVSTAGSVREKKKILEAQFQNFPH